jgi:excisionase family DNA binding protein
MSKTAKKKPSLPIESYPAGMRMRPDQVAGVLNCSAWHVRCLIQSGALEAVNVGTAQRKCYRVIRESVLAFLARNKST